MTVKICSKCKGKLEKSRTNNISNATCQKCKNKLAKGRSSMIKYSIIK